MAIHSSILAWRIPWTEETGSLHSIGLQRAGHNWITSTTRAFLFSKLLYFVISTEIMLACLVTQSCLTLCYPVEYSPPGSSVHGIFQARILEWVVISFSRGSFQLRVQTHVSCISCIGKWILYHCATWEALNNDDYQ